MTMRRFESGTRFWEVDLRWSEYTVRRGASGGEAETRRRSFPDAATAARVVEELVEEMLAEGYGEVGAEARLPAEPEPSPAAPPPPPAAAPSPEPSPRGGEGETAAATIARRFECVEGGSSTYQGGTPPSYPPGWEVEVAGRQYTVRFGRIGTAGLTKVKTFPDPAAAVREAAKLIAKKTGKGYTEVTKE